MSKRKTIYKVKETDKYVIYHSSEVKIQKGESRKDCQNYELLDREFEKTGIIDKFSPEELEIFKQ